MVNGNGAGEESTSPVYSASTIQRCLRFASILPVRQRRTERHGQFAIAEIAMGPKVPAVAVAPCGPVPGPSVQRTDTSPSGLLTADCGEMPAGVVQRPGAPVSTFKVS